jgi:hypothetical protein
MQAMHVFYNTYARRGSYKKCCHKLKQIFPDAPVPKQFLKNVRSFQTTNPISDCKRTHRNVFLNEELYDFGTRLELSKMIFGSFLAKQTGVVA